MKIWDIIKEALQITRHSKSLWLFGFFLGLGSSGSGGSGQGGSPEPGGVPTDGSQWLLIAIPLVAIALAALIMRVLSEAALIEGVSRARRGDVLGVRAGFREGWAHWGTVFSINVAYVAASVASAILLALPGIVAAPTLGIFPATVILGVPALLIAIPWLVTLYIWKAFALRIAVLENRHTMDAIRKARLFLHGRLLHGLKLMVATFLGTLFVAFVGIVVIAPLALLVAGLTEIGAGPLPVILSLPVLVPAVAAIVAAIGTFQSSVWTIAYLTEVKV
jgi:hypothetical protein